MSSKSVTGISPGRVSRLLGPRLWPAYGGRSAMAVRSAKSFTPKLYNRNTGPMCYRMGPKRNGGSDVSKAETSPRAPSITTAWNRVKQLLEQSLVVGRRSSASRASLVFGPCSLAGSPASLRFPSRLAQTTTSCFPTLCHRPDRRLLFADGRRPKADDCFWPTTVPTRR
jgi:hypothetical protein